MSLRTFEETGIGSSDLEQATKRAKRDQLRDQAAAEGDPLKRANLEFAKAEYDVDLASTEFESRVQVWEAAHKSGKVEEQRAIAPGLQRLGSVLEKARHDLLLAQYNKTKTEIKTRISEAKADLAQATNQSLKVLYENSLVQELNELNSLVVPPPFNPSAVEDKLRSTYPDTIPEVQPFSIPKPPPNLPNTIRFIETEEYKSIRGHLFALLAIEMPTTQLRYAKYCLVRGAMGVGKTTTTWRAVSSMDQVIPCYARLDDFVARLPGITSVSDPVNVLATLLLYAFSDKRVVGRDVILQDVAARIRKLDRGRTIILHLDEYQSHVDVAIQILSGCKATLTSDYGICVIPIFSGIHGIVDPEPKLATSTWVPLYVRIGALPHDELEQNVASALQISLETLNNLTNCKIILNDCGDFAHLVVAIVEAIQKQGEMWTKFKAGSFVDEDAKVIFRQALGQLETVYGPARWHKLVSTNWNGEGDPTARGSWPSTTAALVRRVVQLAFSKQPVLPSLQLIPNVTLEKCRDSGMFDLSPVGSEVTISSPLLALTVMNRICQFIPESAELENPFGDDWQTLERVAMVSLMVQLQVDERRALQQLRPGADFYCDRSTIQYLRPEKIDFYYLGTYLEAPKLLRGKKGDGGETELDVGHCVLTAASQFAHDGIAIFNGYPIPGGEKRTFVLFSQSKAVEGLSKKTGEPIETSLFNGSISSVILPKMKEGARRFKERFTQFKDAFIVYDIFSDRLAPKETCAHFDLGKNEALFITRSDSLSDVLGGFAARKRAIVDKE